jgi:hypothetical protein
VSDGSGVCRQAENHDRRQRGLVKHVHDQQVKQAMCIRISWAQHSSAAQCARIRQKAQIELRSSETKKFVSADLAIARAA